MGYASRRGRLGDAIWVVTGDRVLRGARERLGGGGGGAFDLGGVLAHGELSNDSWTGSLVIVM